MLNFQDLDCECQEKLRAYLQAVLEANARINLTAVRDEETAWNKHIIDSLQGLTTQLFDGNERVIDVGTGAGFPGMVLAIARPDIKMTLLEATRKKCDFLTAASTPLAANIEVLCARAEDAGRDGKYRERFDVAVARAVGSLSEVAELCLPLVKSGGQVLLWRGAQAAEEVSKARRALSTLRAKGEVLSLYELPGHSAVYHLVKLEKLLPVPKEYPRRNGLPKQKPL